MVFSSTVFLLRFLPIVYITNALIKKRYSNYFLLLASLFFYSWGEPTYVLVMLAIILESWIVGRVLERKLGCTARKGALIIGIICDLAFLFYFKYFEFFIDIINRITKKSYMWTKEVSLPIGISFFTFQAISYIVDVYKKETKAAKNLINVALYISFFPQLIAGPIVKYRDINQQINERSIDNEKLAIGFKRFIYGLGKKVLIANVLGQCVDTIYSFPIEKIDFKTAWIGALAYTFQIYYDFSGYSDMAIGLGKMFGFDILENFNYPYLSRSISEFWRRWHISLGTWFREYLYIPLGGNKKGRLRTYTNLVIVFFLTGLWHGADLSFVIWGMYHGFFSIVERVGFGKVLEKHKVTAIIYTFLIVNFGWVLFRADTLILGIRYIARMALPWRHQDVTMQIWEYADIKTIACFLGAVLGAGVMKKICPVQMRDKWKNSIGESVFCVLVLILSLAAIASDTYNPFIYFQF